MIARYELLGKPVNPKNARDIYIEASHDQAAIIEQAKPHVGIRNLYLVREDILKVMDTLTSAPGITEGVPFTIYIKENGVEKKIEMYLDLMEALNMSRDGVEATIKMRNSLDWLDDKADSFTFESLYEETGVTPFTIVENGIPTTYPSYKAYFDAKCIYIPYILSTIPNYQEAITAVLAITFVATQLYSVGKSIAQWAQPMEGLGLVVGVGQLVLEIAYAILLIATLIGLIIQMVNALIQPIKYHGAMLMCDLYRIAAVKMGLDGYSSIYDTAPFNQMAFLPEKYNPLTGTNPGFSLMGFSLNAFGTSGFLTPKKGIQRGYFNGTGGDFLRLAKQIPNGKLLVNNNSLLLERHDYYPSAGTFQIPDIEHNWVRFNTDEMFGTFVLKFAVDQNDKNTFDKYIGTILQATHQQLTTVNKDLQLIRGLREIQIPAARGVAKTSLTFVEQAIKDLEFIWHGIEILGNIGIAAINILIGVLNSVIVVINILIAIWNTIIDILHIVTDIINSISDAIDDITFGAVDLGHIDVFDNGKGKFKYLSYIDPLSFISLSDFDFSNRLNTLLLENDIVSVPKLLLIDTARPEFTTNRIGYISASNAAIIHAQYLWDKFWCIDAMCGPVHNRFTQLAPALKSPSETNPFILSLDGFENMVNNPKILDNFGEEIICDSVRLYIEQNGRCEMDYRKPGWSLYPNSNDGTKRKQEILINFGIKTTLPNGN